MSTVSRRARITLRSRQIVIGFATAAVLGGVIVATSSSATAAEKPKLGCVLFKDAQGYAVYFATAGALPTRCTQAQIDLAAKAYSQTPYGKASAAGATSLNGNGIVDRLGQPVSSGKAVPKTPAKKPAKPTGTGTKPTGTGAATTNKCDKIDAKVEDNMNGDHDFWFICDVANPLKSTPTKKATPMYTIEHVKDGAKRLPDTPPTAQNKTNVFCTKDSGEYTWVLIQIGPPKDNKVQVGWVLGRDIGIAKLTGNKAQIKDVPTCPSDDV